MALAEQQRLPAAAGLQHRVAGSFQYGADQLPNTVFILYHQNRLGTRRWSRRQTAPNRLRLQGYSGKVDRERGALAGFTVYPNISAALLYDAKNRGQSQSGAFTLGFCGEERFENVRLCFLIHTAAGIAHREHHIAAGNHHAVLPRIGVVEFDVPGFNEQSPARRHGISGIHRQVHDHLFDLPGIRMNGIQCRLERRHQFHILPEDATQHSVHIENDDIEVEHPGSQHLPPAKGQQLTRQGGGPFARLIDFLNILAQRIAWAQRVQRLRAVTVDYGQQIVKVVGYATGQAADRLHLLRLEKLRLEVFAAGDIAGNELDGHQAAALIAHQHVVLLDPYHGPVPVRPAQRGHAYLGTVSEKGRIQHWAIFRMDHLESQVRVGIVFLR